MAFTQAAQFWNTMDIYAQQHTVDGYRFELGNVANTSVVQKYIDTILNNVDNCLARRVAYGLGATLPAKGTGQTLGSSNGTTTYPSFYPLNPGQEQNKSNAGLSVAVLANDTVLTESDLSAIMSLSQAQQVSVTVVAPHMGELQSGINASANYITASSVFFDAVLIGSSPSGNDTAAGTLDSNMMGFVMQAYGHGKAIGALGQGGEAVLMAMGVGGSNSSFGLFSGDAATVMTDVLDALSGPVRFPQRFPTDDTAAIC
jgi:catalase